MTRFSLSLIVLSFFNHSLVAQNDFDLIIQNPSNDIHISDLSLPIHKMTIYKNFIWASDYGDGKVYKSIDHGKTFKEIAALGSEYFESALSGQ